MTSHACYKHDPHAKNAIALSAKNRSHQSIFVLKDIIWLKRATNNGVILGPRITQDLLSLAPNLGAISGAVDNVWSPPGMRMACLT
jgi:hypothetical protein